jgi:hypothetical protein
LLGVLSALARRRWLTLALRAVAVGQVIPSTNRRFPLARIDNSCSVDFERLGRNYNFNI